jgi:hypothetical protein
VIVSGRRIPFFARAMFRSGKLFYCALSRGAEHRKKPAVPRLSKGPLGTAYTCGDLTQMDIRPTRFKGVREIYFGRVLSVFRIPSAVQMVPQLRVVAPI